MSLARYYASWRCGERRDQIEGQSFEVLNAFESYAFNLFMGRVARVEGRTGEARRCLQLALHFANGAGTATGLQVAALVELAQVRLDEPRVTRSELWNLARAAHVYGDSVLPRSSAPMIMLHGLESALSRLQPADEFMAYAAGEQVLLGLVERRWTQFGGVGGWYGLEHSANAVVSSAWRAGHSEGVRP